MKLQISRKFLMTVDTHRNSKDDENELKSSGYMTQTVDDNGEAQYEESDDDIDELFDADEDYGDGNSEQY